MHSTSCWRDSFPELADIPGPIARALDACAVPVMRPAGTRLFGPGASEQSLFFLISGTIRLQRLSETGCNTVTGWVYAREGCVLTAACLMAYADPGAEAIAETDVEAVAIPSDVFDRLMASLPEFRAMMFKCCSDRVADVLLAIEEVGFGRADIRLAERLLDTGDGPGSPRLTPGQLSVELGTAPEVVSGQLHEFQRRGWVSLGLEDVTLRDAAGLRRLTESG